MEGFRSVGEELRNWGRWGPDDERGTLNLATPERIVAAAALIRRGAVFDLGIPFDSKGPQTGEDRINPMRFMSEDCASDEVYECFFCGPPIKFTGAVGSPVNPLAIK